MNTPSWMSVGSHLLFQGDSITDAGRISSSDGLGGGYVSVIAGFFQALRPDLNVKITNRGISGNRTAELQSRWKADCLDLKPNVLSIKIGVNDVWRKFQENEQKHIPLSEYQKNLEDLCQQALNSGVRKIVLISPTTITNENKSEPNDLIGDYNLFVREFAKKIGAVHVEARQKILNARETNSSIAWTPDGCHPGTAGHTLIAIEWWKSVFGETSI